MIHELVHGHIFNGQGVYMKYKTVYVFWVVYNNKSIKPIQHDIFAAEMIKSHTLSCISLCFKIIQNDFFQQENKYSNFIDHLLLWLSGC